MFSKSLLSAALALTSSPVAIADFLVMDVSPGDSTCSQENVEASIMIQTGHCLKLPVDNILLGSYMLTSCSPGEETLSVTVSVFSSDDCSTDRAIVQDFTFDTLPSTCVESAQLSCQTSDPYAVTENWPAFGLYVDDSTCARPTLMAAFAPNCNTYTFGNASYSTDLTCSTESGASFSVYGTDPLVPYEGSEGCSGTPSEQRSMVADQCLSFADVEPITVPDVKDILDGSLKDVFEMLQLNASDLYYFADCGGGDNIPGIETNANSGSQSDSGGGIDGGMMALYLTVGAVAAGVLVVGGFVYMRRKSSAGNSEEIRDDLLDKENVI